MAHGEDVTIGRKAADGVLEGFALGDGAVLDVVNDDNLPAHAQHRRLERARRARGGLVEEVDQDLAWSIETAE